MVDADTIKHSGRRLSLDKIRTFHVREDDIFLLTLPKSGTTWMKEILSLVLNGGDTDAVKDVPCDVRVPYVEFALSADEDRVCAGIQKNFLVPDGFCLDKMASPRVLCSHLRREFLPTAIEEKKVKVIYVARNPKDVAVSMYHMVQLLFESRANTTAQPYRNFGDFLADFLEFREGYQSMTYDGSKWHEHVLEWWDRRHEKNVLFLKYEDMLKDLAGSVRQIAKFLEVHLTEQVVEKITDHCTFKNMKQNKLALKSSYCEAKLLVKAEEASPFVRKGIAGGWRTYFTAEENDRFDKHYRSWLKDSDLEMTFEL